MFSLGCLIRMNKSYDDGTPCARKLACTVWSGGKAREYGTMFLYSKAYLSL